MIIVGQITSQEEADEIMYISKIYKVAKRARILAESTKID